MWPTLYHFDHMKHDISLILVAMESNMQRQIKAPLISLTTIANPSLEQRPLRERLQSMHQEPKSNRVERHISLFASLEETQRKV